jgi:hypothetical protein
MGNPGSARDVAQADRGRALLGHRLECGVEKGSAQVAVVVGHGAREYLRSFR